MGCVSSRTPKKFTECDYNINYDQLVLSESYSQENPIEHEVAAPTPSTTDPEEEETQTMAKTLDKTPQACEEACLDEVTMSLEDFVTFYPLPQRAKVIGGYYADGESPDSCPEFSTEELVHILQVVCPTIKLLLPDQKSTQKPTEKLIEVPTSFQDARFRVVSQSELTGSSKPRVFRSVQEMIEVWPHTVKALAEHRLAEGAKGERLFKNGERLRLVRINYSPEGGRVLECKLLRGNMGLIHLPLTYIGNFAEVDDPKGYTLLELVSIARVGRNLKILPGPIDQPRSSIFDIPDGFDGYIKMKTPEVFVQMKRVPRKGDGDPDKDSKPFLVRIDCPIDISPREDTYQFYDIDNLKLKELVSKYYNSMPFVARITSWMEETSVLQQNVVRPGTLLIFFKTETTAKILAKDGTRKKYYMIPVDHNGLFYRTTNVTEDCALPTALDLKLLDGSSFPFDVKFTNNTGVYSNVADAVLPAGVNLTFDAFIDKEKTVVVAKLYHETVGNLFHLPMRTPLSFHYERKWTTNQQKPAAGDVSNYRWSDSDVFAEEITGKLYNKLMEKYGDYEWVPAELINNNNAVAKPQNGSTPSVNIAQPPTKPEAEAPSDDDDDYLTPTDPRDQPKPSKPLPPPAQHRKPVGPPPPLAPRVTAPPLCPRLRKNSPSPHGVSPKTSRRSVPAPPPLPPATTKSGPPPVPGRHVAPFHHLRRNDRSLPGAEKTKRRETRTLPPPPPPTVDGEEPMEGVDQESTSSTDSDGQSYSYIDMDTLEDCVRYRQGRFQENMAKEGVSIPLDGNISHFTAEQMLLFLREIHAPSRTVQLWRQLRIDGKDFAKMADNSLTEYSIMSTVVQFFRDRSQLRILAQL